MMKNHLITVKAYFDNTTRRFVGWLTILGPSATVRTTIWGPQTGQFLNSYATLLRKD